MKKIALLFAAFTFFIFIGCDNTTDTPTYSVVGKWQPTRMVETYVNNNTPITEVYDYTDCQKLSRWSFNEDNSGNRTIHEEVGTVCATTSDKNFIYVYDSSTTKIQLNTQGSVENGRVTALNNEMMNLIIEETVGNTYHSMTYTFKKVN